MPFPRKAATLLHAPFRRRLLAASGMLMMGWQNVEAQDSRQPMQDEFVLYTFGDSILDCGRYNDRGLHPGGLLVRNDDVLFPEFRGKDLSARGSAKLVHRAVDGATVGGLPAQARDIQPVRNGAALLTIGGNDLLQGLASDAGPGIKVFGTALERFVTTLAIRPVLLGNVYDPSFNDDSRNFLGIPAAIARANHERVNEVIASVARRHGTLIDLRAHFLRGQPSWFTRTIEPSLTGASEVRRAFLPALGLA